MTRQAPRGPRPPVKRETPTKPKGEVSGDGSGQALPPIEAHGAIEITGAPPATTVETLEGDSLHSEYEGRVMVCRKPFKLNGKRYAIGDLVPVDAIPRPESWVHTGYLKEREKLAS